MLAYRVKGWVAQTKKSFLELEVGTRGAVQPYVVVVLAPGFCRDLGFSKNVEDLSIKQLTTQLAIERFDVAILPGATQLDE